MHAGTRRQACFVGSCSTFMTFQKPARPPQSALRRLTSHSESVVASGIPGLAWRRPDHPCRLGSDPGRRVKGSRGPLIQTPRGASLRALVDYFPCWNSAFRRHRLVNVLLALHICSFQIGQHSSPLVLGFVLYPGRSVVCFSFCSFGRGAGLQHGSR